MESKCIQALKKQRKPALTNLLLLFPSMHTSIGKYHVSNSRKERNREKKRRKNNKSATATSPTELKERSKKKKKIKLSTDVIRRRNKKRGEKKKKHGYLERDEEKQDQHGGTERERERVRENRSVSSSSRFILRSQLRSQRSISFRFSSTYTHPRPTFGSCAVNGGGGGGGQRGAKREKGGQSRGWMQRRVRRPGVEKLRTPGTLAREKTREAKYVEEA